VNPNIEAREWTDVNPSDSMCLEDDTYVTIDYLYQHVGVESFFYGSDALVTLLLEKSSLVDVYCSPFSAYGVQYTYVIYEPVSSIEILGLEERYLMIRLYYYSETKRADQVSALTISEAALKSC